MHHVNSPRSFPDTVGALMAALDSGINLVDQTTYPPHNVYREDENTFGIEMAVAGMDPDQIEITVEKNVLTVSARPAGDSDSRRYLHRGIARRGFRRTFHLGEYMVVRGAEMNNGLLRIDVVRELPEEARPRQIAIRSAAHARGDAPELASDTEEPSRMSVRAA